MNWNFQEINAQAETDAAAIQTSQDLEAFRIKYIGKKGVVSEIFGSLGQAEPAQKGAIGKGANDLRTLVTGLIEEKKAGLSDGASAQKSELDVTIPGVSVGLGHKHILTQTIEEICGIFERLGFIIQEGPEIETEFNNFTALNIPIDHPSRDAFDTFYLEDSPSLSLPPLGGGKVGGRSKRLLRSHTSPGQIRIMQAHKPPMAVIIPGRVYRPDAVDASHSFMFHQIEGLLVDEKMRFSDLKGLLSVFCKRFFGPDITMRFRPHFFPFTEPSAEVDISCYMCKGRGCSTCGRKGWLEILGCGMVHPKVFEHCGYPKGKYAGLAFGIGVERIAMLKHGIHDIRLFYENDVRFLEQF